MMKKLLCILLALVFITSFWACEQENPNQKSEPDETPPPSAYDQLNDEEKLLYEALIIWTTKFEHHDTRVLAVGNMTLESKKVAIQLQYSENEYLGQTGNIIGQKTVNKPYWMGLSETSSEIIEQKGVSSGYSNVIDVIHDKNGNVDCGNINRALKEYWDTYYEDMGLN